MKTQLVKYGVIATLFSMLLAGCSSTDTSDTSSSGGGVKTMPSSNVATGKVDSSSVSGSSLDSDSGVARVFYFEFDKAILNSEARAALSLHAQSLKANPVNIRLEGHADERGTREYNLALGERRAYAVSAYLKLKGVGSDQIEIVSFGEEKPVDLGKTMEAYSQNRRVEIQYQN